MANERTPVKATRRQLKWLAALGVFDGTHLSKAEASAKIIEAKIEGREPDWKLATAQEVKINQLINPNEEGDIKPPEDSSLKKGLNAKELRRNLNHEEVTEDEYLTERVNEYQEYFTTIKGAERFTKKPTNAEIRQVLMFLDQQIEDWENSKMAETYFIGTLAKSFPYLTSNKKRQLFGRGRNNKSGVYLIWAVVILAIILYVLYLLLT